MIENLGTELANTATEALIKQKPNTPSGSNTKTNPRALRKKTNAAKELTKRPQKRFKIKDVRLSVLLSIQAAASLGDPMTDNDMIHRSSRAAVDSLGPRDGLEMLMAVQMVGVHNLAMKFLASAALQGQSNLGIELFTNYTNRLLRTFTAQVEALKSYRSKGEQKIAVEHVHVHHGGQAFVGAVSNRFSGGGNVEKSDR
jgi:hypothetical protein